MIAIFLLTAGTTMAAMVLISLWVTRRKHATGLRRVAGWPGICSCGSNCASARKVCPGACTIISALCARFSTNKNACPQTI